MDDLHHAYLFNTALDLTDLSNLPDCMGTPRALPTTLCYAPLEWSRARCTRPKHSRLDLALRYRIGAVVVRINAVVARTTCIGGAYPSLAIGAIGIHGAGVTLASPETVATQGCRIPFDAFNAGAVWGESSTTRNECIAGASLCALRAVCGRGWSADAVRADFSRLTALSTGPTMAGIALDIDALPVASLESWLAAMEAVR